MVNHDHINLNLSSGVETSDWGFALAGAALLDLQVRWGGKNPNP